MVWAKIEIAGSKTLYLGSYYNQKTSDENSLKKTTSLTKQQKVKIVNHGSTMTSEN
jgi:hypothetical protein